jgi:signal transduction histidine kinase
LLVKDELVKNTIKTNLNLEEELYINTNKNELVHVLINLINNAKDAFNENNIKNRVIDISTLKEGDQIILKVCDNAGGIPESIIDKIFDSRFTTKEHMQGTGIGLYMSKQILEKHNAKIEVFNNKNGACFKIVF